jgi:hypothetical protein
MAEADQLGPLSSGLSRAWSWPLVATVTSDIVDVLELGKPPLWCVPSTKVYVKRFSMPAGAESNASKKKPGQSAGLCIENAIMRHRALRSTPCLPKTVGLHGE